MSVSSITIKAQERNLTVTADEIPAISEPMFDLISPMGAPQETKSLQGRVKDLIYTTDLLKQAEGSCLKDKIIAVACVALFATLVAATVFGFIANPAIGLGFLVLTLGFTLYCNMKCAALSHSLCQSTNASSLGDEGLRSSKHYTHSHPCSIVFAPLALPYLLMTRVSTLQTEAANQQTKVEREASLVLPFWAANTKQVAAKIDTETQKAEQSLLILEKLPIRSPEGERALMDYMELLCMTQTEVHKAVKLSQKLNQSK